MSDLSGKLHVHAIISYLILFDMGGGALMASQKNVFDHCAETLWNRKLKLSDFLILIYGASRKVIFNSLSYPVLL